MTAQQRQPANYIDKRPLFSPIQTAVIGILLSVTGFFAAQQGIAFNRMMEKFEEMSNRLSRTESVTVGLRRDVDRHENVLDRLTSYHQRVSFDTFGIIDDNDKTQ
jgi:hypothetical protein